MPEATITRAGRRIRSRGGGGGGGGVSLTPGDVRPIPDPTVLTTQAQRESINALREIIEVRLEAMDKAAFLQQEVLDRVVPERDQALLGLQGFLDEKINKFDLVMSERFKSIATQFAERDTRTEQTSKDSKVAVDAALQAAKEAVGEQNKSSALAISKSEAATTKQIDAIGLLIQSNTKNIDDKIDDLKTRLTAAEAHKKGSGDILAILISVSAILLSVIMIVVVIVLHH